MNWNLIIDPPLDGASNMAIDAELLQEVESAPIPRTIVRFYQWISPTVSLGRNQQVNEAVDEQYCRENGIDIVHRPTGGRAVLHDDELTYAVASNDSTYFGDTIYGNYKRVSEALCSGFRRMGVEAVLACDTRKPNPADFKMDPPCFVSTSRYELMVNGRKIVGSAQRRLRRGFLQHGSMPIVCDAERLSRVTRIPDASLLRREMAGITEFTSGRPPIQVLTDAMVNGFEQYFEIQFESASVTRSGAALTAPHEDVIKNRTMPHKEETGQLDDRTREILRLLIRIHVASGDPVGSRTLSKYFDGKLSPASIRNIVADLENAGYLVQPHTSAGRIPSEKGYRYYVDNLPESGKLTKADERMITRTLAESDTPEEVMFRASYLLSAISNNIGIVIAPPLAATQLKHIEFVDLSDGKILVIFVSKSGLLQKKVIRANDAYAQEELDRAGRFLVEKFTGKTLPEIRSELLQMMEAERMLYDRMLKLLRAWNDSMVAESEPSVDGVYVQGAANMINQPEFADIERMRALFRMFEEKGRLVKILNEYLLGGSEGVQIAIGSELGVPSLRDFTIITCAYPFLDNTVGHLGIIGPTRMEYERGISIVGYLGRLVGERIHA